MVKLRQKDLKEMVREGIAEDITQRTEPLPEWTRQVGYSSGIYGCNGILLLGESGKYYAVTKRSKALYRFG